MDYINFDVSKSRLEDYATTDIYINDFDLRDIVADIEYNQLKSLGKENLCGAYEGISPFLAFHLHDHFHGKSVSDYIYNSRYSLFDYRYSGIPGDHTLTCKIYDKGEKVIWTDFRNYSKIVNEDIDYGALRFEFAKDSYDRAIDFLKETKIRKMYS